jgi:hypothetical protein
MTIITLGLALWDSFEKEVQSLKRAARDEPVTVVSSVSGSGQCCMAVSQWHSICSIA